MFPPWNNFLYILYLYQQKLELKLNYVLFFLYFIGKLWFWYIFGTWKLILASKHLWWTTSQHWSYLFTFYLKSIHLFNYFENVKHIFMTIFFYHFLYKLSTNQNTFHFSNAIHYGSGYIFNKATIVLFFNAATFAI